MKLTKHNTSVKAAEQGVIAELASIRGLATNHGTAAGAVTKTYAALKGMCHVIYGYHVGYDAAPAAGSTITITMGGDTVYKMPITAEGLGPVNFPRPLSSDPNKAAVVTLSAPGGAVNAYLNVFHDLSPGKSAQE